MVLQLDGPVGDKVTLKVPVFSPDKSRPQKDKSGKVGGFASKRVGWVTYPAIDLPKLAPMNEFRKYLGLIDPTGESVRH